MRCKREYQEQRIRYESALLLKDKLEKQIAALKREKQYKKQEEYRRIAQERKEALKRRQEERALYLMRKYGYRWLEIVRVVKYFLIKINGNL